MAYQLRALTVVLLTAMLAGTAHAYARDTMLTYVKCLHTRMRWHIPSTLLSFVNWCSVPLRFTASDGSKHLLFRGDSGTVSGDHVYIRLERFCPGLKDGNWVETVEAEGFTYNQGPRIQVRHLLTGAEKIFSSRNFGQWRQDGQVGGEFPFDVSVHSEGVVDGKQWLVADIINCFKTCDGNCNDWRKSICNWGT